MKHIPIIIVSFLLTVNIYIGIKAAGNFGLLVVWISIPYIFPFVFYILYLKGIMETQVVTISGVFTSLFPIPFYFDALNYNGTDGQGALIFVVMPFYQIIGLILFSAIGYIAKRINRDEKH